MESTKKKVLIITYYWPPASGPGVQRFLKISKYLTEFNWQPVILTVKNTSASSLDTSLEKEISELTRVYKTKTFEPFEFYNKLAGKKSKQFGTGLIGLENNKGVFKKLTLFIRANFFIPDARKAWCRFAINEAKKIIKENQIEAIITTGPPHSTHLTGLAIKKELNLPWIADLRDPWTNIFYNKFFPRSKKTKKKDQYLEDSVVKNADLVTVVSKGLLDEFKNRAKKTEIIYNGFDPADIPETKAIKSEKFVLSYVGNFKPNQNVIAFWESISELKNEIPDFQDNFKINLTGNLNTGIFESIKKYALNDFVETNPFVSHSEAIKLMVNSGLLLFIIPDTESNHLIITGKLFEYIASGTPVLPIGPSKGNASEILRDSGRDAMINYDDKNKIKEIIKKYYSDWLNNSGELFKHPETDNQKFSRKFQAKQFADQLEILTEK
ncbi:MAG: glycosyltransferase [Bacteroidales bacterium]|nr:glycosyltransferase [Bacteroidales bacterium]